MATTYFCNLLIIRDTAGSKLTSFYGQSFYKFPTQNICIGSSINADIIVKSLEPEHVNMYFQKTAMFMNAKANTQLNTSSMRDTFVSGAMRIPFSRESLDMFRWQIKINPHLYIAGQIHKENIPSFTLENKVKQKYGMIRKICEKEYISYRLGTRYVVQIPSPNYQDCTQQVAIAEQRKKSKCAIFPYIKHINSEDHFIISEYFNGITLENYRGQNGVISGNEALIIIKNISKHLKELEGFSIVLTPDNILADHNNEVRITGLSKRIKGRYHYYNPPECTFDSMEQDVLANIYTLGVLLFELLSGRNLFNSLDDYKEAVQTNKIPDLQLLQDTQVKSEIQDLVKKMLLFSRKDRISHIDLQESLDALTQKEKTGQPTLMEKLEHIENIEKTVMRSASPLQHINSILDQPSVGIDYTKQVQTSVRQPPNLGKNTTKAFVSPVKKDTATNDEQQIHEHMLQTAVRPRSDSSKESGNNFSDLYDEMSEKRAHLQTNKSKQGSFLRSNQKDKEEFNKKSRYVIAGSILFFVVVLVAISNPFSQTQTNNTKPQKIVHKKTSTSNKNSNSGNSSNVKQNSSVKRIKTTPQQKQFLRSIQTKLYVLQKPSQKYLNSILKQITIDINNYKESPIIGDLYNIVARLYLYKIYLNKEEQLFEPFWEKEWLRQVKVNMELARDAYKKDVVSAQLQLILLPWMPEKNYEKNTAIVYRSNEQALKEIDTWLSNLVKNR
ncbi:hypothetical protein [Candidatus Uabimicrobium sp. HlEnr_7]|uniref:protein kinase domain-containing protein n=1 Tax=Candidatus Uabimicrobium helgolandensis TaxID=3095367 RepID=UPI0035574C1A